MIVISKNRVLGGVGSWVVSIYIYIYIYIETTQEPTPPKTLFFEITIITYFLNFFANIFNPTEILKFLII